MLPTALQAGLLATLAGAAGAQTAGAPPAVASAPAAAEAPRLQVSGFRVEGNTLLPAERIDAVLAPHAGQRSVAELQAAAAALQALYAQAGYGGVVAFVPPQQQADGVVRITVVEGRLARVAIEGQKQFSADNVRAGLPALVPGSTPRLQALDTQIGMSNENPAKQLQVLLQPGAAPGETDARIVVSEQPLQRWTASLDNRGNRRTGHLRAGLGWQHANLSDRDDVLTLNAQTAPDKPSAVKVLSGSYRLPLYARHTFVDAYAAWSDVDGGTTTTVVGPLSFAGRGRLAGVRATLLLPRWGEADQRLALGLDYRAYLNSCRIAGLPEGACGSAGESVSVQPVSLEYSLQRGGALAYGLSVGLHHNLQLGGGRARSSRFEAVREGAQPRFTALRSTLQLGASPYEGWNLQLRAAGQFTNQAMVPGEQFGIGGAGSVRGYRERELAGDRGLQAALELLGPELLAGGADATVRALGFFDAGWVGNRRGLPCEEGRDECSLRAWGLGLRAALGRWQGTLHVAQALKAAPQTDRHDLRAHVAVSTSF
ncbi:ShlB/FhaC/HecB family hemolysin secretion/activation protein [Aquincola sp. J276]|uniref:ShlB/FhaC/HecB family hemolysin secretion/activation protein n=1 Tax=Aquincola sp. J276 TaxID=2898432 RepID=UPI002150799A|nr:ShlB/FhaC/HecB family hemolysin secretion/activation protein [Aquincola sp. J276]MCR5865501.1 BamA/TamA family outer membrane protein [Aquincola sp. J276]